MYSDYDEQRRAIAIASKIATIREIAAMSNGFCSDVDIAEMYSHISAQPLSPQDSRIITEFACYVRLQAISEFKQLLLAGIGE